MKHEPALIAKHHRVFKIFWIFNFPVCVALFYWAPAKVNILYLALVSVYANYAAEAATEQGARSRLPEDPVD